jgi:hypothetical protein
MRNQEKIFSWKVPTEVITILTFEVVVGSRTARHIIFTTHKFTARHTTENFKIANSPYVSPYIISYSSNN